MSIDYKKYGERIRAIRVKCLLTQNDVYKKTGISMETQRRLEQGLQEPKISTLEKLSYLYKYDLLDLLANSRASIDFLSDEIVASVNKHLRDMDFESLKRYLIEITEVLLTENQDNIKKKSFDFYILFLEACKNLRIDTSKNIMSNITNLESILLILSNSRLLNTDPFLYSFEVAVNLVLMVQFRDIKENNKAIKLGTDLINKLITYPTHTQRQINHLGALYLNLSYSYHEIGEHQLVLDAIDTALNTKKLVFSNHLYIEFMVRKVIAYYLLGDKRYQSLLSSVIMNENGKRKHFICKMLSDKYSITHNYCSTCTPES